MKQRHGRATAMTALATKAARKDVGAARRLETAMKAWRRGWRVNVFDLGIAANEQISPQRRSHIVLRYPGL